MAVTTGTPPDRRPPTDASRRILAAARALFARRGYEGGSIRDIARQAGVSKANVFHHYGSKAGLYSAVLEDSSSVFQAILDSLGDEERTPRDRIARFARRNLETMLADPASVHLFLRQMLNSPGNSQRHEVEAVIARDMQQLLTALQGEIRAGETSSPAPDTLALTLCILGANFMYFQLRDVLPQLGDDQGQMDQAAFSGALMRILAPALEPR